MPSSRRLEREAQRNLEVIWLIGRLAPDFKTIAGFRPDNGPAIKATCRQLVLLCRKLDLFSDSLVAIDGSKFKAVNARDKSYTQSVIQRRMEQVKAGVARYLAALDTADRHDPGVHTATVPRMREKLERLREQMQHLRAMEIYIRMAQIASHATTARLQLDPANVVQVRIFRLFDDTLWFRLMFQVSGYEQRPELGSDSSFDKEHGLQKFQPGADVQIFVSMSSSSPLRYEAQPLEHLYSRDQNARWMTANHSIQPGIYRWPPPPSTPVTHLHAGFNSVRFEVASVEEPLVGETVDLDVLPPLDFKEGKASVAWLWFGLLWPFFLVAQLLWATCLCHGGLRRREAPT